MEESRLSQRGQTFNSMTKRKRRTRRGARRRAHGASTLSADRCALHGANASSVGADGALHGSERGTDGASSFGASRNSADLSADCTARNSAERSAERADSTSTFCADTALPGAGLSADSTDLFADGASRNGADSALYVADCGALDGAERCACASSPGADGAGRCAECGALPGVLRCTERVALRFEPSLFN